jgi:hypothetical protein
MSASAASSVSGGYSGAFGDDLVTSKPDRGATHIRRARAAVPAADRDPVGVALNEPDPLVRDANLGSASDYSINPSSL